VALSCFISPELDFPVATSGTRASSPAYNSKFAASRMITNGISARIRDIQLGILTVGQIQDPQASVDLFIDAQVIRFASRTSSIVANNRSEPASRSYKPGVGGGTVIQRKGAPSAQHQAANDKIETRRAKLPCAHPSGMHSK